MDFIFWCMGISNHKRQKFVSTSYNDVGIYSSFVVDKVNLLGRFIRP